MALYSALLPVVELHRWRKNGDHPDDRTIHGLNEGRIVGRHFSLLDSDVAQRVCETCGYALATHGMLNRRVAGIAKLDPTTCYVVCPGDYIRTLRDPKDNRIVGYSTMKRTHVETFYELYKEPTE